MNQWWVHTTTCYIWSSSRLAGKHNTRRSRWSQSTKELRASRNLMMYKCPRGFKITMWGCAAPVLQCDIFNDVCDWYSFAASRACFCADPTWVHAQCHCASWCDLPFGRDHPRALHDQSEFVTFSWRAWCWSDNLTGVASIPTIGTSDEALSGTYLFIMIGTFNGKNRNLLTHC